MAYKFTNQNVGKATIKDEESNSFSLNGINTKNDDANVMMSGLSIMLGIVGWEIQDASRIVTQDVEEE